MRGLNFIEAVLKKCYDNNDVLKMSNLKKRCFRDTAWSREKKNPFYTSLVHSYEYRVIQHKKLTVDGLYIFLIVSVTTGYKVIS